MDMMDEIAAMLHDTKKQATALAERLELAIVESNDLDPTEHRTAAEYHLREAMTSVSASLRSLGEI